MTDWDRDGWTPQIGELVKIRDWDDMVDEFGISGGDIPCEDSFVADMRQFCGLEFTITNIFHHDVEGHGTNFNVSFDMIEPVENCEEVELEDELLVEFLNNFS